LRRGFFQKSRNEESAYQIHLYNRRERKAFGKDQASAGQSGSDCLAASVSHPRGAPTHQRLFTKPGHLGPSGSDGMAPRVSQRQDVPTRRSRFAKPRHLGPSGSDRPDLDAALAPNGTSPPILTFHAVSATLGATMGLTYLSTFTPAARAAAHGHACLQPVHAAQTFGRFIPDALANPSLRGLP
jgi:hypothetical protein